jgi:hypothetical protein
MIMRVAVGIHGKDIEQVVETYHLMSERYFTHASPTLFNAGTPNPQLSSCFLVCMKDDSIEGIYDTLKQCAMISKTAGGIGLNIHCIRATGYVYWHSHIIVLLASNLIVFARSYIAGTNGYSNGIVPMLRAYDATARYVIKEATNVLEHLRSTSNRGMPTFSNSLTLGRTTERKKSVPEICFTHFGFPICCKCRYCLLKTDDDSE